MTIGGWADRYLLRAGRVVILAIIVLQVAIGLPNGLHGARSNYVYQAKGAQVLLTINHQSDGTVRTYEFIFQVGVMDTPSSEVLEHYHLNVFAPGAGPAPRAERPPALPAVR